jgi:hypothetical protein
MAVRRTLLVLSLLAVALTVSGCAQEHPDSECDLVVHNASACRLSIYVDGREAFAVRRESDRTLDDIGPGRHVVEAFDPAGKLVQRRTVELARGEDFYWALDTC